MSQPQLAPPGAGLPKPEALLVRHLVFPFLKFKLNKANSLSLLLQSGQTILDLARPLTLEQITKPVLIKRLPGMEDSSRFWSVELTIEHIQIVNAAALYLIRKLEDGKSTDLPIRTEEVKPNGGIGLLRVSSFENHLAETRSKIEACPFKSRSTHEHPWFGELKPIDWLRLIAFHQDLHLKQIQLIVKDL